MVEKPIIFSADMVRAILEGRKNQTRRVVKPQPELMINIQKEGIYYGNNIGEWRNLKENSELAKQRLYGRGGREYLFKDAFFGLWEKGVYGMVSVSSRREPQKGLQADFYISQQSKENNAFAPFDLRSVSWNAAGETSSASFGWESEKQSACESLLGNATRKLEGQKSSWKRNKRGETSHVEIDGYSEGRNTAIVEEWKKSEGYCKNIQGKPICDLECLAKGALNVGTVLYVREMFMPIPDWQKHIGEDRDYWYKANEDDVKRVRCIDRWRPSIHMPRAAARLFLRVTGVRCERLQEISDADAKAEGMDSPSYPIIQFKDLWRELNDKRDGCGWESNPWVWVYEFERVTDHECDR